MASFVGVSNTAVVNESNVQIQKFNGLRSSNIAPFGGHGRVFPVSSSSSQQIKAVSTVSLLLGFSYEYKWPV